MISTEQMDIKMKDHLVGVVYTINSEMESSTIAKNFPYTVEHCLKSFTRQAEAEMYICDQCDKNFTDNRKFKKTYK